MDKLIAEIEFLRQMEARETARPNLTDEAIAYSCETIETIVRRRMDLEHELAAFERQARYVDPDDMYLVNGEVDQAEWWLVTEYGNEAA